MLATLNILSTVEKQQTLELEEDNDTDPTLHPKFTGIKNARKTIENLKDYFGKVRGASGILLTYIVRPNPSVLSTHTPSGALIHYPSMDAEMISRSPLSGQYFEKTMLPFGTFYATPFLLPTDGCGLLVSPGHVMDAALLLPSNLISLEI